MHLTIEDAGLRNLNELSRIERECFGNEAFSKPQIARLLADYNCMGLVAKEDSQIIGFCIASIRHRSNIMIGHILTIDVLPSHRSRGVGAELLKEMEKNLKAKGAETCQLEVREDNIGAIMLYKKMGYEEVRTLKNYYENAHGLRMKRQLTGF